MTHARIIFAALAAVVLCACNQSAEPQQEQPAAPPIVMWSAIPPDSIRITQGVIYSTVGEGSAVIADISGVSEEAPPTGHTGGVGVLLPQEIEAAASGKQIRVTVLASAAAEPGAMIGVAYSTSDVGNSGWQQFAVTTTPTEHSFVYNVPTMVSGNGDYIGFRSYGADHIRVHGYRIEIVGPPMELIAPDND